MTRSHYRSIVLLTSTRLGAVEHASSRHMTNSL